MPRQQPEQQAPPVQRLRLQYAKRGRARFASSRDFSRAFERALRRAGVPMAYSSGFNPHPRISYANAAPTGAASEAEYVEIGLSAPCDAEKVRAALDASLPDGLDVVAAAVSPGGGLADLLTASVWTIDLGHGSDGVDQQVLTDAVADLLGRESYEISRMTKSGLRTFDVRGAVIELQVTGPGELRFIGRHAVPLVRPDDIVTALRELRPALAQGRPALLTRLDQGEWIDGTLRHPFDR